MEVFVFITRTKTPYIESRVRSMVSMGVDAYSIIDDSDVSTKRFIAYPDKLIEEKGWTYLHKAKREQKVAGGWEKAVYFGHKTNADYVWFCEDDMYWNKPAVIRSIMEEASKKKDDLIAYPLAPSYETTPKWGHWEKASLITKNKKYWSATFNQLCRVSKRLLVDISKLADQRKRLFFHEAMFATVCNIKGYTFSYYNDLQLPIHIVVRWDRPFKKEQVDDINKEHKYVLLHPVKFLIEAQQ